MRRRRVRCARSSPSTPIALVEAGLVGGECSYFACMPSKALLRPPEALAAARLVPGAAEAVTGTIDVARAFWHRDQVTGGGDDSSQERWLADRDVELVRGLARIAGPGAVEVDGRTIDVRPPADRDRVGAADPAHPGPRQGRVLDEPGGDDGARGARTADRDRRRAGRVRARPGLLPDGVAGDDRRPGRPAAAARSPRRGQADRRRARGRGSQPADGRQDRSRRAGRAHAPRRREHDRRRPRC